MARERAAFSKCKNEKKRGITQCSEGSWATFWSFLVSFWGLKWKQKSNFFQPKKQDDFEKHFVMILVVLGTIFGVEFRSLEYSKMSISPRRNTNFHFFCLPKSHSKNASSKNCKKMVFGFHFGLIFGAFWLQNDLQKSDEKYVGKKTRKKWSPRALGEIDLSTRRDISRPEPLLEG